MPPSSRPTTSVIGPKRTSHQPSAMSAFEGNADIDLTLCNMSVLAMRKRPCAQRYSIVTFLPSVKPASPRPRRNPSRLTVVPSGDPLSRNPITGSGCCARTASGHAATLPKAAINSRLPTQIVIWPFPKGIMPAAMRGRISRPNRQVCGLLHSPIMLQCMSPVLALRWGNRPASLWIAEDFGCCASG